jgi:hypothetical protein
MCLHLVVLYWYLPDTPPALQAYLDEYHKAQGGTEA